MASRKPPNPLPPQPVELDAKDAANIVVRGVASLVPGPADELVNFVIKPSLEKRRIEWFDDLAERVRRLEEEERLTLDDLQSEPVVDVLLQASRAALATSSTEKRDALRNAVLNSVLPGAPDEAERFMFLRYVEDFTPWHLRILKLFQTPTEWQKQRAAEVGAQVAGSLAQAIEAAYPELAGRAAIYDAVWLDLSNAQFVNSTAVQAMMSGRGMLEPRMTERGNRFLAFIEEP